MLFDVCRDNSGKACIKTLLEVAMAYIDQQNLIPTLFVGAAKDWHPRD